jgi:hypothetical protein
MLSLLLDENVSPTVAEQLRLKRPELSILTVHEWRDGEFMGVADEVVLMAAWNEGLTLVTYDTQILSELGYLFTAEAGFGGVIFVDDKTIAGNDFGGLVRALTYLWDRERNAVWTNRLMFLQSPPEPPIVEK